MDGKTAILLIDPYNDFLHPEGKLNGLIRDSLAKSGAIEHLHQLISAARSSEIPIFYCMHQQTDQYFAKGWTMMNRTLTGLQSGMAFEAGTKGTEYFAGMEPDITMGDVVVSKHWNSSSFQNTDLDYQLRQRGIRKVILAGMVANTCLESTARYAYEFGYSITMLADCTAGFSDAAKEAAVNMVWPLFANEVTTVGEWVGSLHETGSNC